MTLNIRLGLLQQRTNRRQSGITFGFRIRDLFVLEHTVRVAQIYLRLFSFFTEMRVKLYFQPNSTALISSACVFVLVITTFIRIYS